jgi:pilus assembly protein Flp/PilA
MRPTCGAMTMNLLKKFLLDQKGATAIEYGLIAGLIAVAIITAITTVGTSLANKFNQVSGNLT